MYFALFIFVARRLAFAVVSFGLAAGYAVAANWPGMHLDKVGSLPAALLPFSFGALLFFAGDRLKLPSRFNIPALVGIALLWMVNLRAVALGASADLTFYFNLGLCVALVALLAHLDVARAGVRAGDKFLGDLAYPLFLVHWIVGFFLSLGRGEAHVREGLFLPALLISLVVAVAMVFLIDRPIEKIRRRVRPVSATTPSAVRVCPTSTAPAFQDARP